ncbi:MAG: sensor histidine kinase [Lachnospiraceae bacterium]|nr:sensor histidine kinase [Lachnospiraceae bacterium]MBP3569973.1 sensor histidine kinase [Lachnospiraceae bacterium]
MKKFLHAITKKLNNIYLKKKLFLFYAFCAILPVTILGIFLITDTKEKMMDLTDSQITAANQANRNMLMSVTSLTTSIANIIASDDTLQTLIATEYSTPNEVYTAYRNFSLLEEFSNNHAEITDLRLYISNPSLVSSGKYYAVTPEIEGTVWYQELSGHPAETSWIYTDSFSSAAHLYLLRKITLPDSENFAVLVIGVSNNYLSSMNHNSRQITYLTLNDNIVFYSTDKEAVGLPLKLTMLSDLTDYTTSNYLLNGNKVFGQESTLKVFSSSETFHILTINTDNRQMIQTLLVISLIILIVALIPLLVFTFFSDTYTKRLLAVREQMHRIAQGNLSIGNDFIGDDELGELFRDMKTTITGIQELHLRILTEQKEKDQLALRQQQIQFELLASQINPHFLFNTLETIRMHALLSNQTELNNIILKLGQTLRYALDAPASSTTLAKALEYLESYLEIQHFRFQDKLNYSIQIHPNLEPKNCSILPFLLQPIVENSVTHGFSTKKKGGKISICAFLRSKELIITISDNGCGIPADKLAEMNEALSSYRETVSTAHIGVHNVNNRIKLHYGESYGLSFESSLGQGTTATIKIPYKEV